MPNKKQHKGVGRYEDLTGIKFGKLTVVSLVCVGSGGKTSWLCACECGGSKEAKANLL